MSFSWLENMSFGASTMGDGFSPMAAFALFLLLSSLIVFALGTSRFAFNLLSLRDAFPSFKKIYLPISFSTDKTISVGHLLSLNNEQFTLLADKPIKNGQHIRLDFSSLPEASDFSGHMDGVVRKCLSEDRTGESFVVNIEPMFMNKTTVENLRGYLKKMFPLR